MESFWVVVSLAAAFTVINKIGFSAITEKLLAAYTWLFYRSSYNQSLKSWKELKEARYQLSKVSAQDEFAKWARQQRIIDKLATEYEKLTTSRQRSLMAKSLGVSLGLRIACYVVLFWVLNVTLSRTSMKCFPVGFFGPLDRIISLPKATKGCLSASILFALVNTSLNRIISLVV